MVAMVVPLKLDDLVLPSCCPCNSHGLHRRLGSSVGEGDHFSSWNGTGNEFRNLNFEFGSGAEHRSVLQLLLNFGHDPGVPVPENQSAVGHEVVNVTVPINLRELASYSSPHQRLPYSTIYTSRMVTTSIFWVFLYQKCICWLKTDPG